MGHLFSLTEIYSDDLDMCELRFRDFKLLVHATNIGIELPRILLNLFNKFGYTFNERAYPKVIFLPVERNPPAVDEVYLGIAHGFIETYLAQCDFYNLPASSDVVIHIEDLAGADNRHLKLNKFIGFANGTEYSIPLVPLLATMRHNTYFTTLTCEYEKTRTKEIIGLIADVMLHNHTLTCIDVEGVDADEGWIQLGEALKNNPSNALVDIRLNGNTLGDKVAATLAAGLSALDHSISTLRMANTKMQAVGLNTMLKTFGPTQAAFQQLEEINFSGNSFGGPGSIALADWLLKGNLLYLKKIYLSNCGVELPGVLDAIRTSLYASVEVLDVSGGKLEDYASQLMVSYLGRAQALKELICVGCLISGHNMSHILNAIKANQTLMDLRVDLSNNELNSPETAIHAFSKSLSECIHIRWIGLRELNLPKSSLLILANAVGSSSTLTEFDLSGNLRGGKETVNVCESVVQALNVHPNLVSLTLDGKGANVLGKSVFYLFTALGEACTLQELNIRGHGFGDDVAKDLFDVLRWNTSLKVLDVDNNALGPVGWLAIKRCLHANRTLTEIRYPKLDIARLLRKEKEGYPVMEFVRKLWAKIQMYCENNKTGTLDKRGPPFTKPVHGFVKRLVKHRSETIRASALLKEGVGDTPTSPSGLGGSNGVTTSPPLSNYPIPASPPPDEAVYLPPPYDEDIPPPEPMPDQ